MWLLIAGNPVEGYTYYGPYNSFKAAVDSGEQITGGGDWWVVTLHMPPEQREQPSQSQIST